VSWQGFATKRIIIVKRPKTHVSLKRKKKNLSLHRKNILENGLVKLQQDKDDILMPPYHSWRTVTHVHSPKQLEHKECLEEGSAITMVFFFWAPLRIKQ